jgi:hypothetical protein
MVPTPDPVGCTLFCGAIIAVLHGIGKEIRRQKGGVNETLIRRLYVRLVRWNSHHNPL